jgi:hypothetical protein
MVVQVPSYKITCVVQPYHKANLVVLEFLASRSPLDDFRSMIALIEKTKSSSLICLSTPSHYQYQLLLSASDYQG